ncbi:MAG: SDR family NAD(P)-dependent oxidoreductase [Spirochaetota bacterium]
MGPDLKGRTALVTGASRGIGRSVSLALAGAGARVFLLARSAEKLREVAREIEESGGVAEALTADLGSADQVRGAFAAVRERAGALDILVNNAALGLWGRFLDFPLEDFDRLMQVNVRGTYLCCQEGLKLMLPAGRGYIINIASVVGFKGYPNQSAYTASKHAVMGMTKSLAVEAQEHGVLVAAISPGGVDTMLAADARPDLDRSRLILPEDIARSVLYLLSLSDRAWVDHLYIRRRTSSPF